MNKGIGMVLVLLAIRLLSCVFFAIVIRWQLRIMKLRAYPEVKSFRWLLFVLTIVILVGNLFAVIINLLILSGDKTVVMSPQALGPLGTTYALINALITLLAGYVIYKMYRTALKPTDTEK